MDKAPKMRFWRTQVALYVLSFYTETKLSVLTVSLIYGY